MVVAREPLRRVREFAFAPLTIESEPIDPRLLIGDGSANVRFWLWRQVPLLALFGGQKMGVLREHQGRSCSGFVCLVQQGFD